MPVSAYAPRARCSGNLDRRPFGTGEGPKRKLGGADFDDFSDLGMSKCRNLDPQLPGPCPNPKGTPRTAKHRFQNLSPPRSIDLILHHFRPDILRPHQDADFVAGRKSLIAISNALPW